MEVFKDKNLSWKARGILAYILSLPSGWRGQIFHLREQSISDGKKSLQSGLKELVENGYAIIKNHPQKDGRFQGKYYIFFSEKTEK